MEQTRDHSNFSLTSLLDSEQTLDLLFNNLDQTIVIADSRCEILFINKQVNEHFLELYGHKLSDKTTLWDLVPANRINAATRMYKRVISGETVRFTLKFKYFTGRHQWFEYSARIIPDENGSARFIVINGIDISHIKNAEQKIRASEEKYKNVVQSQSELICKIKFDGTIIFVNNAFCKFFGKEEKNILGTSFYHSLPNIFKEKAKRDMMSLKASNPVMTYLQRVRNGKKNTGGCRVQIQHSLITTVISPKYS
jgi:PAS domain S-box-containing protein